MGKTTRRRFTAETKAKIALAALKGQQTVIELAAEYGVHPTQVTLWKKQMVEGAVTVFGDPTRTADAEELQARLYQEIGQLKVELDWLKKKSGIGR